MLLGTVTAAVRCYLKMYQRFKKNYKCHICRWWNFFLKIIFFHLSIDLKCGEHISDLYSTTKNHSALSPIPPSPTIHHCGATAEQNVDVTKEAGWVGRPLCWVRSSHQLVICPSPPPPSPLLSLIEMLRPPPPPPSPSTQIPPSPYWSNIFRPTTEERLDRDVPQLDPCQALLLVAREWVNVLWWKL